MKGSDKIDPRDYKFAPVDPDPDFSPEHNQQVIVETIKRSEALWRQKQRSFEEGTKERAEAVATYVESLKMGGASTDLKKYFGEKYLAYFRGYELIDKLKKAQQLGQSLTKKIDNFHAKTQSKRLP